MDQRAAELVAVASTPIVELRGLGAAHPTLVAILRRAFDPADREKLTVSAFGSAL